MEKRPNGKGTKDMGDQSAGIPSSFPSCQAEGRTFLNDFPLIAWDFHESWFVGSWV